jgi:hypothetical protein
VAQSPGSLQDINKQRSAVGGKLSAKAAGQASKQQAVAKLRATCQACGPFAWVPAGNHNKQRSAAGGRLSAGAAGQASKQQAVAKSAPPASQDISKQRSTAGSKLSAKAAG